MNVPPTAEERAREFIDFISNLTREECLECQYELVIHLYDLITFYMDGWSEKSSNLYCEEKLN
jgi:hypothetical protein